MGRGIDLARAASPEHAAMLDNLKDQLLVVFLKRLEAFGSDLRFHVSEIDDTAQDLVAFSVDPATNVFKFELRKKA